MSQVTVQVCEATAGRPPSGVVRSGRVGSDQVRCEGYITVSAAAAAAGALAALRVGGPCTCPLPFCCWSQGGAPPSSRCGLPRSQRPRPRRRQGPAPGRQTPGPVCCCSGVPARRSALLAFRSGLAGRAARSTEPLSLDSAEREPPAAAETAGKVDMPSTPTSAHSCASNGRRVSDTTQAAAGDTRANSPPPSTKSARAQVKNM